MDFGAAMFFTDYSMAPGELARALEERGFESVWAPEHSHIPLSRQTPFPGGGDLPKRYYDTMDPFVTLTAAAAATKRLRVGTGVALIIQRDPIQTAKLVASIDQVSAGRFLFGVGNGWNAEEMADHGTTDFKSRHKLARERIEAMKLIWTQAKPEYHGEFRRFRGDHGVAQAGAEAAPADHRRRRLAAWGAPCGALRRWLDSARQPSKLRRCHGIPTRVPQAGRGGRARPCVAAGQHLLGPGGFGDAAPLPGRRGCPRGRQPAVGESGCRAAHPRPVVGVDGPVAPIGISVHRELRVRKRVEQVGCNTHG